MFGRNKASASETAETTLVTPPGGKGRPTPSRKEAEAARRQNLRIPKDPKEARKAARERDKSDRARQRAGMMSGDDRYLPPRDAGPVKAMVRDYVDSRFTLAEYFIFVAIGVLALGFIRNPAIQSLVSIFFFAFTLILVIDMLILLTGLHRRVRAEFPDDPGARRGVTLYAVLRTIQLRRLRLPKPRVRRGGKPIPPKS